MASSKKRTPFDLLNDYYKRGMKPPEALTKLVAEREALKKPPLALDPPQMLAGGMAGGMAGILPRLIMNEMVQGGFDLSDVAVPKAAQGLKQLGEMARKGVSGQTKPLGGGFGKTIPLSDEPSGGPTTEPQLPNGVKLPGGNVAAKGTSPMGHVKANPNTGGGFDIQAYTNPTAELNDSDISSMAKTSPEFSELLDMLKPPAKGKATGSLPPPGPITKQFGQQVSPAKHGGNFWDGPFASKTKKLTPFEAHENMAPWQGITGKGAANTFELPGMDESFVPMHNTTNALTADNRTMSLEPEDIEEMTSQGGPKTADLLEQFKKNLSPKDTRPLPENTLYHGLNVFGSTPAHKSLSGIAQEGLKGGWFSEEPHQPFGPNFIATTPEDLPPMLIREKQFSVDPEKEIIPRWNKYPTESLEARMKLKGKDPATTLVPDTIKGRPAKRSLWPNIHQLVGADEEGGGRPYKGQGGAVVPPEKLFMADRKGDIIGRLAPKGGKGGELQEVLNKAGAFKKVLEKGTTTIDNVWKRLFGSDPDLSDSTTAQKAAKMKQFLKSAPSPDNSLFEHWSKIASSIKQALEAAGEDIPK